MSTGTLVRINDPCLEPLLRARGDALEAEIERLMLSAQPLIGEIVSRYTRQGTALPPEEGADVRNTTNVRLLAKLRALPTSEEEAVYDFRKYVATITYNTINDYFRQAFPVRARLKGRLMRLLGRDPRLAVWSMNGTVMAGLAEWNGRPGAVAEISARDVSVRESKDRPAEALIEIFGQTAGPVQLDALIDFLAGYWNLSDTQAEELLDDTARADDAMTNREMRDSLAALWSEIRELRPLQRKALLLNLRSGETVHVLTLLVLTGTATHEDVAAALEITTEDLDRLWDELPLDDLRIASRLGMTRQQVINLRKTARAKLARRMAAKNARK